MFKYLVALVLGTPLIGIYLMEQGAYGTSVGAYGEPNGATVAYAFYALIVVLVALAIVWFYPSRGSIAPVNLPLRDDEFRRAAIAAFALNLLFLGVLLFGAGGYRVLLGQVSKGEFRTTLGGIGALAYLLQRNIIPGLCALVAALYMGSSKRPTQRRWLMANLVVVFISGLTWGFKSTPLTMLLPAFVLLFWRIRFWQLAALGAAGVAVMLALFQYFDADVEVAFSAVEFLWRRVTVLQGDVAWAIWDMHVRGESFPDYGPTLLAVMGDRMMQLLLGLDRLDYTTWVAYHYDLMLTNLAGYPLDVIEGGHNVTATPFSEGVVALGVPGMILFGVIAGALVGLSHCLIRNGLQGGRPLLAALASTYASSAVINWLNSGAIVALAHVSTVFGVIVLAIAISTVRRTHFVWRHQERTEPLIPKAAALAE